MGIYGAVAFWITVFSRDTLNDDVFLFQPFHTFTALWEGDSFFATEGNFIGNILLFIPIGFLFPIAFRKDWKITLLFGCCCSLCVELLQLILQRGYFEIDDILLNTAGAGLGYFLLYLGVKSLFRILRGVV